ncbi:NUDIX hydrolase [Pengzhenrongella frigida]|uniref:NUDIX domain-containing protein n=1 Tax=Pengzhenrongella frigida TaxID=1259133 RepID=A0A4Q5N3R2_9MICO|nr:NUDIX domain-containing protein [Cellulomonas sp. HLT2-17]RYV52840.1 NUDIX domain-containing protein [Cellulomonas sp. HLT2-17]
MTGAHGPVHQLGPEWEVGSDGVRFRLAARVILLDADDRVLLLHGCDVDQRERSWWFTVGGGIDPGESQRDAAARELFEETGITLDPAVLVGPVYARVAVFDFFRESCRQEEVFFLGRYHGAVGGAAVADGDVGRDGAGAPVDLGFSRDGWTEIEVDTIDELRWWDLDALEALDEEVFPARLPTLVRELLGGWDGVTRSLEG